MNSIKYDDKEIIHREFIFNTKYKEDKQYFSVNNDYTHIFGQLSNSPNDKKLSNEGYINIRINVYPIRNLTKFHLSIGGQIIAIYDLFKYKNEQPQLFESMYNLCLPNYNYHITKLYFGFYSSKDNGENGEIIEDKDECEITISYDVVKILNYWEDLPCMFIIDDRQCYDRILFKQFRINNIYKDYYEYNFTTTTRLTKKLFIFSNIIDDFDEVYLIFVNYNLSLYINDWTIDKLTYSNPIRLLRCDNYYYIEVESEELSFPFTGAKSTENNKCRLIIKSKKNIEGDDIKVIEQSYNLLIRGGGLAGLKYAT
jgi:hypothetical protein